MTESPALVERAQKYLSRCEGAISGSGGHNTTFRVVNALIHGFCLSAETAYQLLRDVYNPKCSPPWRDAKLRHKIKSACNNEPIKGRGYLLNNDFVAPAVANANILPATPSWPLPDEELIARIVASDFKLLDLFEQSPVRFDDEFSHTEEIIDVLFPGDPLLCVGKNSYRFATRRREVWRGHLGRQQLVVPNPMIDVVGQTADGHWSEHTKEQTSRRVYLVIEFDFIEFSRDGQTLSRRAPLIREWRAQDITVADACAALHLHLAELLPLICVTHSGGKSLHGWYRAFDRSKAELRHFMEYAVRLGGDRATWTRSQFVRLPDGLRENGNRQNCFYLNPSQAAKA